MTSTEPNFTEMSDLERDVALLELVMQVANIADIHGEAIGKLDERIHTLELESVV